MKAKAFSSIVVFTTLALLSSGLAPAKANTLTMPQEVAPKPATAGSLQAKVAEALHSSPVMFIQNVGQFDEKARLHERDTLNASVTTAAAWNVELVGQIGGATKAVAVHGNYAYIGIGPRLVILDVSDPTHPAVIGQTGVLPAIVQGVKVSGNYAYVAEGYAGLRIINVSDPTHPTEVGFYDTPGYALGVAVSGNYVYVADWNSGLRIINVSDPAHPREVGFYETPGDAQSVDVSGNYAYVADYDLRIIDISNPTAPTEVGFYNTPGNARGVAVSGNYAYVADEHHGLRIINVSNPTAPTEVGFYEKPWPWAWSACYVVVSGNYAYVAYDGAGLSIINISNPAAPTEVGSYNAGGNTLGLDISGNYAYVADYYMGLRIINVSNPTVPTEVSFYNPTGYAQGIAVLENYVYIACYDAGLCIINVSNPAAPNEVSFLDMPPIGPVDVAVSGNYAYVAELLSVLYIINVSDPAAPTWVSSSGTGYFNRDVALSENYAYVATDMGLAIINVSNPTAPTRIGFYDMPGGAYGVAVSGNYAYVAAGDGLHILNVSDPAHPYEVGYFPGGASGVAVSENYAYIAAGGGLRILNVSDPAHPYEVGYLPRGASGVVVSGNYAYLTDGWGLRIINVSDPAHPCEVGFYETPGNANSVAVSGNYAYVADGEGGLVILRFMGGVTYSISGRVVDGSGNPIPDVTISDNAGHTTTTGSDGRYILSGLAAGTYTITPSKSGYIFSPASRTVTVPPDATGQDFTGSLGSLAEKVQKTVAKTNTLLDKVLAEANKIAQDGDYFAVQMAKHEIDLVVEDLAGSASILASGFDELEELKDSLKMDFPSVLGRGWGHIIKIKRDPRYEAARDFFCEALWEEVSMANIRDAVKEFFRGAHMYYAADFLDTAAENLTEETMKSGLKLGLRSELALQRQFYSSDQKLVNEFKQDVTETGNNTIANLPSLTPEEEQAYIEDLTQRHQANKVMVSTLELQALPLHLARNDRERGQGNWITEFLVKYLVKKLAFLYADGLGALAAEIGSTVWDLYQNIQRLNEDTQMMSQAVEGMGGCLNTAKRIYLNSVHGMDNIVLGIKPQIAKGYISSIANISEGEYKLFGRWWWCERSSYSKVTVFNPTPYSTEYHAIATYGRTGFLGTSYQPLVEEGVNKIPSGSSGEIQVYYKQDDKGVSPDEGSPIEIELLGNTETGTYYVAHGSTTWKPVRVTASGILQAASPAQADAPTIPYPIRTRMVVKEDTLTYIPYIWVDNPFTETVVVTLTQPLPAGVQVIDPNGGSFEGNSLRWHITISPEVTVEITHAIRYLERAGQFVEYPKPLLEMANLGATAYVTFTGETEFFVSQPPLSATGIPPKEIIQGNRVTIPITVTNRLADSAASGTVRLSLIDFKAEREVYSDTQDVTVPAGGSQVVNLVVDTATVPEGDYLLVAIVESNGGQKEVFSEYVKVKLYKIYLPLVLRNH